MYMHCIYIYCAGLSCATEALKYLPAIVHPRFRSRRELRTSWHIQCPSSQMPTCHSSSRLATAHRTSTQVWIRACTCSTDTQTDTQTDRQTLLACINGRYTVSAGPHDTCSTVLVARTVHLRAQAASVNQAGSRACMESYASRLDVCSCAVLPPAAMYVCA